MYNKYKKAAVELVARMSVKEAAEQLIFDAPAIERLGIPAYNYWNEGLHGIARGGTATVFPQAIALAAMFDTELLYRIADVIATETRAKYNEASAHGDRGIYKGITLWSPNINLFRDPRWGRGQETYGEDPYLTSRLGVAFIRGLQGDGEYLKTAACAKHYAVHSGPEQLRHSFNAEVSAKDLEETYLPAFRAAVCEGEVESVMGAYNRTNGEPCCAHSFLLKDKLREEWGFDGHVVSDFGAIRDFHENHHVTADAEGSAAMALKAGCDLNAGYVYSSLYQAYEDGLVTEEEIRQAAVRVFTTRVRLGMFDDACEYNSLGWADVDTDEHRQLSYEASLRSIVLLKNDGLLPLDRSKIKTIGVIGPQAASTAVLNGNYNGTASQYINDLDGIRAAAGDGVRILYSEGCHMFRDVSQPLVEKDDRISEALSVAEHSDVVVLCLGLDASVEGEEGDAGNGYAAGDKDSLYLPASQWRLFTALKDTGKPIVLVLNTGSAMDVSKEEPYAAAILQCWYSGQYGGRALGDIIFGKYSPSGKLPVSFSYEGTLPEFTDYSMKNRTYRYIKEAVLYPFGYGLSYTAFKYENIEVEKNACGGLSVSFDVCNTGNFEAYEISQVYISNAEVIKGRESLCGEQPKYSLCAFTTASYKPGERRRLSLSVDGSAFDTVCADGRRQRFLGRYILYAGGHQPDTRSNELCSSVCLTAELVL